MRRALLVLALVACSDDRAPRWRAAGATTPRAGGTLRIAFTSGVTTLDPAIAYDEPSFFALHPIVDGLVGYARDGTAIVPMLAERWDVSADGLTYTFHLRKQIKWADGRPIVAADFERALERPLRMEGSPWASHLAGIVGAQDVLDKKATDCTGIAALDAQTLAISLTAPNAALLYELALPFAAPITADYLVGDRQRHAPVASGPYELVAWDDGRMLELRRRAHYHDPARQHIERVVILENVPRELQFMMLERGELDAAERLTASDLRWIQQQPAWAPHLHTRTMMNAFGSRMHTEIKPFDDRRVRQALNYAVDKQRIVRLLTGTAIPAHGTLAPGVFGRDDTLQPYPHDPAKARALLREAGYPDGFTIQYMTLADEEAEKLAVALKHDLAQVGVRVDITLVTPAALGEAISKRSGPAFSIIPWAGDYPDPTSLLDPLFHSRFIADTGASNYSFFKHAELDELLDKAKAQLDPDKRAAMYRRVERIVYDEAPWIFGYHQVFIEVTQPYVRDYTPHPVWIRDFTYAWLDLGADGKPVPR
jgi:ABC-type transport system substrate-binding protein